MLIEIRDLVKEYSLGGQTVRALGGIDLSIEPNEFVAVMGPSGSGKSTLLNLLGCLDQPTSGRYCLRGQDVADLTDDDLADIRNHEIGFVFQTFNLLPRSSAAANVELPLVYAGLQGPERRRRVARALQAVGLEERAHHKPHQLSGGERQRVAIARALVNEPALLLADEPTGNLDTRTGDEILRLFSKLHQAGHTILVVTHEPHVARSCGRLVRLRDGWIEEDLPTDVAFADPRDEVERAP